MIVKRNIGISVLLSIITCGIYGIYWFIQLTDESNHLSGDHSTSGVMAFLFTIITCGIYSFFWAYNMGKKICEAQRRMGVYASDNSILYLILNIFGLQIVVYCIAQSDINNMVEGGYVTN